MGMAATHSSNDSAKGFVARSMGATAAFCLSHDNRFGLLWWGYFSEKEFAGTFSAIFNARGLPYCRNGFSYLTGRHNGVTGASRERRRCRSSSLAMAPGDASSCEISKIAFFKIRTIIPFGV
jgi:hypothetical protein